MCSGVLAFNLKAVPVGLVWFMAWGLGLRVCGFRYTASSTEAGTYCCQEAGGCAISGGGGGGQTRGLRYSVDL